MRLFLYRKQLAQSTDLRNIYVRLLWARIPSLYCATSQDGPEARARLLAGRLLVVTLAAASDVRVPLGAPV